MGCGNSTEAVAGAQPGKAPSGSSSAATAEQMAGLSDAGGRQKYKGGKLQNVNKEDRDRDDDAMFDVEVAQGEQFMAVKPWVGQITEPDQHPQINGEEPDIDMKLHYIYGYRCADSRQNVFFNAQGRLVYMSAAVGIQLNHQDNTQKFFGGGPVGPSHKSQAGAQRQHSDDITSMAISPCRQLAATGQVGSRPVLFAWDTDTMTVKDRWQLPKGGRGIKAVAWCRHSKRIACVDQHNDHYLRVYEVGKSQCLFQHKCGSSVIYDISWSPTEDKFVAVGKNTVIFFNGNGSSYQPEKGLTGGRLEVFTCAAHDPDGNAYVASVKGSLLKFEGRSCKSSENPQKSAIYALHIDQNGKIWTGGRNDVVKCSDGASHDFKRDIRAIDTFEGKVVVGTRDGTITVVDGGSRKQVMHSHSDGQVWGFSNVGDGKHVLTSADDNKLLLWDYHKRVKVGEGCVNEKRGPSRKSGQGASTLSHLPPNQQARAVAVLKGKGDVAVCDNTGGVSIREGIHNLDSVKKQLSGPKQWCEAAEYSPCGNYLAVGSHDNNIYVYNTSDYSTAGVCKAHNSFITALDWSEDSKYIRSNCGAYELLFFTSDDWSQDKDGRSNTKTVKWASHNVKISWTSEGVFRKDMDGSDVNHCALNNGGSFLVTGDDWGGVNLYNFPVRPGAKSKTFRAHSEHVVRVAVEENDEFLFSCGGYDQTLMQWQRC